MIIHLGIRTCIIASIIGTIGIVTPQTLFGTFSCNTVGS